MANLDALGGLGRTGNCLRLNCDGTITAKDHERSFRENQPCPWVVGNGGGGPWRLGPARLALAQLGLDEIYAWWDEKLAALQQSVEE